MLISKIIKQSITPNKKKPQLLINRLTGMIILSDPENNPNEHTGLIAGTVVYIMDPKDKKGYCIGSYRTRWNPDPLIPFNGGVTICEETITEDIEN